MAVASDILVVGGGIAGASLAFALASEGLGVTVLEATEKYRDRVRGEAMQAWGVKEARDLGVEQVLLNAGAHVSPVWKQYGEGVDQVGEIPMAAMVPEIPGTLNLWHPGACQALIEVAAGAGATIVRGVREVQMTPGRSVKVSYVSDAAHETAADLVVGADGRASTVRKQAGITLEHQEPNSYIAGLLVDGLVDVPDEADAMVAEGDLLFYLFHQGGGRARAYLCFGVSGQHRFSGREAASRFLAQCRLSSFPWSEAVVAGTPAGPCATYAGDDTWTSEPYGDSVVLLGDAAGHNDPILGQGLSIGLRDARIVRDLILDGARQPRDFAPYGTERSGRMETLRLLADIVAVTQAEDADNRSARRALLRDKLASGEVLPLVLGGFAGPETVPDDMVDSSLLDAIRRA